MQIIIGWIAWLAASTGFLGGTLWQLTLTSPQNGAVISETPNDKINVSGGFYRPNNGKPPIRGTVSCNGVAGSINETARTWVANGITLLPGLNTITCTYLENNKDSIAQIQVTYQGGVMSPPVAGFQYSPHSGPAPLLVSFDASESYDPDGGNVVSYEWAFGDGSTIVTYSPVVGHSYTNAGTYQASLQVRDDEGILSDPVAFTIQSYQPNNPPVAHIAATPSSGFAPLTVSFNGTGSSDSDGTITSYLWTFPDNTTATTSTASYTFTTAGNFNVTLTVKDNNNVPDSETFVVQVSADANGPTVAVSPVDGSLLITTTPSFTFTYSDAETSVNPSTARVWVDNIELTTSLSITSTVAVLAFNSTSELANGEHEVIFEIKDSQGNLTHVEATYTVDDGTTPIQSAIAGKINDTDGSPLSGVTVTVSIGPVGEVGHSATSDTDGKFILPFTASGDYTLSFTKSGYSYSAKKLSALAGFDAASETAILKLLDSVVTPISAASGGTAQNSTNTVKAIFPPNSLPQNANIILTDAQKGAELPFVLPELSEFTFAVDHRPDFIYFNQPVTIEVANDIGLPANAIIPLGVTDYALQQWVDAGTAAQVSADGSKIVYQLSHFSASDANTGGQANNGNQNTSPGAGGNNCNPEVMCCDGNGSIIKGSTCSLGTTVSVPKISRIGKSFGLSLRYNSDTVKPLVVMNTVNQQDHLEQSIALNVQSNVTVGGIKSTRVYSGKTNIKPSVMKEILPFERTQGARRTGSYPVEHELAAAYGGQYGTSPYFGGPVTSSLGVPTRKPILLKEKLETRTEIQDQTLSPFGAGWMLEGYERLHLGPDGAILWETGRGVAQTFLPLGPIQNQILSKKMTATDDLIVHEGFVWESSCAGNSINQYSLTGRLHKSWPVSCPTRLATTRRGGILAVVENGSKILRLGKNDDKKHLHTQSPGSAPITAIAEDGALAVHFATGADIKTVSPRDGSIFHYVGSNGLVKHQFKNISDIKTDTYDNIIVVDKAEGQIYKIFAKNKEVRTIFGGEKHRERNTNKSFRPTRLIRDSKLKRFFVQEESGQLWHWQGPGHDQVSPVSFAGSSFAMGIQKEKSTYQVFAYSAEVGPIFATQNGLWWKDQSKRNFATSYQSPYANFKTLTRQSNGSYIMVDVDKTITNFDANGYITSQVEPDGQSVTFIHTDGKLTSVKTPAGDGFNLSYSGAGYLESIVDTAGRTTEFVVNSAGDLVEVTLPDNSTKEFSYDSEHLLSSETDEAQRTTQYQYREGRLINEIYPGNRNRPVGPAIFKGWDETLADVIPRITPESQITDFTSPEGRTTRLEPDQNGLPRRLYSADGSFTHIARNVNGMPELQISNEGRKLIRKFDAQGRETNRVGPDGYLDTTYDPATGKVASITEAFGAQMNFTYNSLGQLVTLTDFIGFQTTFTYHPNGALATSTNARNETTTYEIDSSGNVAAVEDHLGNRTEYVRDDAGNVLEIKDPKQQVTTMTRDALGRVLTVTTPINGTTTFTYTETGKLETLTDARNKTTSWSYNEQDLVASETNPLGLTEYYFYDGDGLMIKKTLRSGENIFYEYDVNERLKKITTPTDVVQWTYDKDGLPLSVGDNDSQVTWSYDGLARLIKETQTHAPAPLRFFYDQNKGQLIRRTLGSQISEAMGYNVNGSLISLTYQHYGVSRSMRIIRDELARPAIEKFTPGGEVTREFDEAGRILSIVTKNKSSAVIGQFGFNYDPNSNITGIDQTIDASSIQKTYVYDSENRLTEATHGSTTEAWNLDLLGNWLGGGRVFNNANQMTEDQNFFYTYDQRGNLIQKSPKIGTDVTSYEWDFFDKLIQVETPTKRVLFKYDATGRRIERTLEDLANNTIKTRRWSYLKDDQWTESDELNQVLAVTLNGESIDSVLSMSIKSSTQTSPGIALEPAKDHLGSIYSWTNASTGSVVQKQSYTAYGETTVGLSSPLFEQLGNLRGYTSREYDPELGIYYYRARYYDPGTGRFLSEDPIGFESGDSNFYRYTENNPVRHTDPFGLEMMTGEDGSVIPDLDTIDGPIEPVYPELLFIGPKAVQCGGSLNAIKNANPYLRIGPGRKGAEKVYRISIGGKGQPVHKHIDLWKIKK